MVKIICLANSKKNGDRCIAGIDICTGKWIRPISNLDDGRVSTNLCLIDNEELKPLDIVDIPFDNQNNGYEVENLTILPGTWKKIEQVLSSSLLEYSESEIIYSQYSQKVPKFFLDSLKLEERRSLQLIKATVSTIYKTQYNKWEASLSISNQQLLTAKITDIVMIEYLNNGLDIRNK